MLCQICIPEARGQWAQDTPNILHFWHPKNLTIVMLALCFVHHKFKVLTKPTIDIH